jgi:hypothetical protein
MTTGSYMPQFNSNAPLKPYARLEKWIWILIYGGLFLFILGIATGRTEPTTGWLLAVPGGIATVVGIVLIYVRSRLTERK